MWSPSAVLFHTRSSWDLVHGKKFAFYILPIHDHTMSRNAELDTIQKQLLDDSDYYRMVDDEYGKEFQALGNSGCQKLAAELDYTHRIERENCVERDSYTRYEFTVSILDSGNRVLAQDVGSCDTQERPTSSLHNIRAMAKTRAWQRALKTAACVNDRLVSDLGPTERAADAQPRAATRTTGKLQRCKAQRVKAQRVKAQRVKAQRVKAQRVKAQRSGVRVRNR